MGGGVPRATGSPPRWGLALPGIRHHPFGYHAPAATSITLLGMEGREEETQVPPPRDAAPVLPTAIG